MTTLILLVSMVASAAPTDSVVQEKAIRKFLAARQDAFDRRDVKSLVGDFTDDGEFLSSSANRVHGIEEIEKAYRTC